MKIIVLCIPTLSTAGAEKFVVDLATHLDKKKYKVYVAITRINTIGKFGEILEKEAIEIIDLTGRNYYESIKKQIGFFNKIKPDVIHANIGSILHVMMAAKLTGIQVKIYTVHNEAKLLFGNSKLKKTVYKLAFKFFGFLPVAICPSVKASMINEFGKEYSSIPTVNNGVDVKMFHPAYERADKRFITIINTGSMYAIKNQKEIIEAFSEIYKENNNVRLIILGDGEKRKELENLVTERGLSGVVEMPGICSNVNEYLQASDIYVSASLTEGLPLSMLEAMACGLPIVTSDAGGSVDLVKTGMNGIVFSKKDRKALEKALDMLITDEEKRKKYAKNSRKVAEKWSIENCVKGYMRLYDK